MRTGILWRSGEVTMHVDIEQTVTIFLNAKVTAGRDGSSGPQRMVSYEPKSASWIPFKPNHEQQELICLSIEAWYRNRHKAKLTAVN